MNLFALFFLLGIQASLKFNGLAFFLKLVLVSLIVLHGGATINRAIALAPDRLRVIFQPFITMQLSLIVIAGCLSGALLCHLVIDRELSRALSPTLEGHDLLVTGTITGVPENLGFRTRFEFLPDTFRLLTPDVPDAPTDELIRQMSVKRMLISWYNGKKQLVAGQRWRLAVRLKKPRSLMNPGSFDYAGWLFQKRIHATGYVRKSPENNLLSTGRETFGTFRQSLVGKLQVHSERLSNQGLMQALLVGVRHQVSDDVWQLLRDTGTSHLLAISGLHIGLAALWGLFAGTVVWKLSLLLGATTRFNQQDFSAPFAVVFAIIYAALAGFTLPTQRAIVMLFVVIFLRQVRMHTASQAPLSIALVIVLVFDPLAPMSPGFWLSFLAVFILLQFCADTRCRKRRTSRFILLIKTHFWMGLLLFPVTALFFGQASIVSPVANLFAIPLISFITVPLLLVWLVLSAVFDTPFAQILVAADISLKLLIFVLDILSSLSYASVILVQVPWWKLAGFVVGLLLICQPRYGVSRWFAISLMMPWCVNQFSPQAVSGLRVTVLDVGQGLAVVVRTTTKTLVYDVGGRLSQRTTMAEAVVLPYLHAQGIRKIDLLILSHNDTDHAAGASTLALSTAPDKVLGSISEYPVMELCSNVQPWRWDGVEFQVIHPMPAIQLPGNNSSCTLLIKYGKSSVLLPGDLEYAGESLLLDRLPENLVPEPVTLIVAPHHGSKTSSTLPFLDTFRPQAVVYSVGYRNRFGFPHESVQMRYKILGSCQYRTDLDGAITFNFGQSGLLTEPDRFRHTVKRRWNATAGVQYGAADGTQLMAEDDRKVGCPNN